MGGQHTAGRERRNRTRRRCAGRPRQRRERGYRCDETAARRGGGADEGEEGEEVRRRRRVGGSLGGGGKAGARVRALGRERERGAARASRPIGRVMHDPRQRTFVRRGGVFHRLHEAEELVELGVGVRVVPVAVRVEQVGEVRGPLRIVRLRRHRGGPREGRVRDSSDERSRRSAMTRSDENGIERREIPRRGPRSRTRGGGAARDALARGNAACARGGEVRAVRSGRGTRARGGVHRSTMREIRATPSTSTRKRSKKSPGEGESGRFRGLKLKNPRNWSEAGYR